MKQIILKELHLENFKGVRNFTLEPHEQSLTSLRAANGKGKTSVMDAWLWLLFGKNSQGDTKFSIKTLDENGNAIPKLPHEVTAVILVDGEVISLRRIYEEKWVKRRGELEETFEGNKESFFINDVPMKAAEYKSRIAEICGEDAFKLITSPTAFTSLSWQKQRDMLFEIAGSLSDAELAKGNKDYEDLLEHLTGKSLDDYKKEVAAKRTKVKKEVDALPIRIDEANRSIPPVQDWVGMEAQLKTEQDCIKEIDDMLSDFGTAQNAAHAEHDKLLQQLSEVRQKKSDREFKIKTDAQADYFAAARKRSEISNQINDYENCIRTLTASITAYDNTIAVCNLKHEKLMAEYKTLKAEQPSIDESLFECPTCHRPLNVEQIEETRSHIIEEFNTKQAARIADNVARGKKNKADREDAELEKATAEEKISKHKAEIEKLQADPIFKANTECVDPQPLYEGDMEWKVLRGQIEQLESEVAKPVEQPGTEERDKLKAEKAEREEKVKELTEKLAERKQIQKGMERKASLEEQLKTLSQELANLEKTEFVIQKFNKARIDAAEERINSMFKMVKFRMFEQQVNGCERECCTATVNGVPFNDINKASETLAGLDILQVISKYFDVAAPVFCDNAEGVNSLPTLENAQLIELRVTDDKELTVI